MKPLLLIVLLLLANTVVHAEITPEQWAKQRAEFVKDRYVCMMEYRRSAPVTPEPHGLSMEAVLAQGIVEQKRENAYVQACLESKGWPLIAPNAESTK